MINSNWLVKNEFLNVLRLLRQTAICDRKVYSTANRQLSSSRILSLLSPNLRQPIFIVGAPRSGTTFLGECLAKVPEISYHFEPIATKAAARYVHENKWTTAKSAWVYRTIYGWLMRLHFDADLRFAEKTPRNSFLIPFLLQVFPDAQFIHIIRDGRDAALSYSKKPWLQSAQVNSGLYEPGGYPYGPYPRFWVESERAQEFRITSDIHRCIWAWRRFNTAVLDASKDLSSQQYYQIRYEDLVFSPVQEATNLLDFLHISQPKSRQLFEREVSKAKTSSVNQWQRELSNHQLQKIYAEAEELLLKLGYSN